MVQKSFETLKQSDLIEVYYKISILMGGVYRQTRLTPLGLELFNQSKVIKQTMLLDIRETKTLTHTIKWQVIEAVGAGCTDLNDTYEIEITKTTSVVSTLLYFTPLLIVLSVILLLYLIGNII